MNPAHELVPLTLMSYQDMTPKDINGCYCYSFAEDLSGHAWDRGIPHELMSNETFFVIDEDDRVVGWNEGAFLKVGLDVPVQEPSLLDYYHVFVLIDGRYYDAETPRGVTHWLGLPFYTRTLCAVGLPPHPSSSELTSITQL